MERRILITAIRREDPDIRLYVLALIALARQLQEEEEAARHEDADDASLAESREEAPGGKS